MSVRLTLVTTLLFGYLLCNSYSAVLISYLASGHSTAPFSTLDDVALKATHALCVRNESYAYLTLKVRRGVGIINGRPELDQKTKAFRTTVAMHALAAQRAGCDSTPCVSVAARAVVQCYTVKRNVLVTPLIYVVRVQGSNEASKFEMLQLLIYSDD